MLLLVCRLQQVVTTGQVINQMISRKCAEYVLHFPCNIGFSDSDRPMSASCHLLFCERPALRSVQQSGVDDSVEDLHLCL